MKKRYQPIVITVDGNVSLRELHHMANSIGLELFGEGGTVRIGQKPAARSSASNVTPIRPRIPDNVVPLRDRP